MSEKQTLECKIFLLSCGAPGKTCIINRYINNTFYFVNTTPGLSYTSKTLFMEDEKKSITFGIWDSNGGEKSKLCNRIVFKDADIIILVYDITYRRTLDDLKYYVEDIKENGKSDASK